MFCNHLLVTLGVTCMYIQYFYKMDVFNEYSRNFYCKNAVAYLEGAQWVAWDSVAGTDLPFWSKNCKFPTCFLYYRSVVFDFFFLQLARLQQNASQKTWNLFEAQKLAPHNWYMHTCTEKSVSTTLKLKFFHPRRCGTGLNRELSSSAIIQFLFALQRRGA